MKNICLGSVFLTAIPLFGCGESVDVKDFDGYGAGHPGQGLVHGGQVFIELVHNPMGDFAMLHAWARDFSTTPTVADSLPLPPTPSGTCRDISTDVFPRVPAAGSVFQDLGPEVTLRAQNGATHVAPQKMNFTDNQQYGIPLGYQLMPFDSTTVAHGEYYNIEFAGSENLNPRQLYFSPRYEILSPPIGKQPITLTRGVPMTMEWEPINQDVGGNKHTADRTFAFIMFIGPPNMPTGQKKWFCPINDGLGHSTFTVPVEVIDALPPGGQIVSGQQTHMMAEYNGKRFDLISIECNRSPWSFGP